MIRSLLQSGLSVKLIRELLPHLTDEPDVGPAQLCAEFLAEVRLHLDRLSDRITVLDAQRSALEAFLERTSDGRR